MRTWMAIPAALALLAGGCESFEEWRQSQSGSGAEVEAPAESEAPAALRYHVMEPMLAPVDVPRRDRYLRATIALGMPAGGFSESERRVEENWLAVREATLASLSDLPPEALRGSNAIRRLEKKVLHRIHETLGRGTVRDVIFTELVVE